MQNIWWLLLSVFIIGILLYFKNTLYNWVNKQKKIFDVNSKNLPYKKKQFFFDKRENDFYTKLYSFLQTKYGNKYVIFSKVRIADLITVSGKDWHTRKFYNNKLMPRHVDFVICNRSFYNPLVVIELNWNSHTREDVHIRDEEKKAIFASAWLPLITTNGFNDKNIALLLSSYIS